MVAVESDDFFAEQEIHSFIKSCIVTEYFSEWAGVMIGTQQRHSFSDERLAYVDLFAGKGKFDNGNDSTPLMIVKMAIGRPDLCGRLETIFNDKLQANSDALRAAIDALPGIEKLKYKPKVYTSEVDDTVAEYFEKRKQPPTLLFLDPFGYKGLTLRLIRAFIKHNFGCDCIFFFNYNRINSALSNDSVVAHMKEIFGAKRAENLRNRFETEQVEPFRREAMIVDEMKKALEEMGGEFTLPFRFRDPEEKRTTHHIFFVSKSFRGYDIMRKIMRRHTQSSHGSYFEYNPADAGTPSLFDFLRPLEDLEEMLLADCAGMETLLDPLYRQHSKGKPYLLKEYREVLCRMEKEGKITMDPPYTERKQGSIGKQVKIKFPQRLA